MIIGQKAAMAIAIAGTFALAACGDKTDDEASSSVTMDAVDVPEGTISDALMPLDARDGSIAEGNGQSVAAPGITAQSDDNDNQDTPASDTQDTADSKDDSKQ